MIGRGRYLASAVRSRRRQFVAYTSFTDYSDMKKVRSSFRSWVSWCFEPNQTIHVLEELRLT